LVLALACAASAADNHWLHVRVQQSGPEGELVRINMPLSLAEKVLPAINNKDLQGGKIRVKDAKFKEVDLRAILDALRTAPEHEFITVQSAKENVRVVKAGGNLMVKVRDSKGKEKGEIEEVEVSVPFPVVDALLSGGKDELDLLAAIRVLGRVGDITLVTVNDKSSKVRIWVDSLNTAE
jgi:hypothetical protein